MELKLLLKKKKKIAKEAESFSPEQKMALHALQKQKQILELKEWGMVMAFVGVSSLLRVPMQVMPNVEPLTFFAILAGWLFGKKKGIVTGVSSLLISNFLVFGGQGPWTIFQAVGFGIAGFLGGFLREKAKLWEVMTVTLTATIIMQLIFNLGWSVMIGFNFLAAMLTGIIFTAVQIISNLIFATFMPLMRKFVYEKGQFNEKELCDAAIAELNSRMPKHKPTIS